LIHRYIKKTETAKGTNWEQKFQKPQNENICLTNLNVENNGNFPILSFGKLWNIYVSEEKRKCLAMVLGHPQRCGEI
jgi:hypothetical protein